jgi:hypothetical protein
MADHVFPKISGIYKIVNKQNGMVYIGSSVNIPIRWYTHLFTLMDKTHHCYLLQEDFMKYGETGFTFEIIKIIKYATKDDLLREEQNIINLYSNDILYNTYNPVKVESDADIPKFMDYINSKWLVPIDSDIETINKYKIYKDVDKKEIIQKAVKYNLCNLHRSRVTFNRVINIMKDMGYEIDTGKQIFDKIRYTYKLVLSFDDGKRKKRMA